jgi:acyl-CoA synthetase (NDP forming)
MTNAGFESVVSADLLTGFVTGAKLSAPEVAALTTLLEAHGLTGLVGPHLPLDLTPMANEAAYLACAGLLLDGEADALVVGLVPLTKRLDTTDPAAFGAFARALADLAREKGKWLGVAVEGGALFDAYRQGLREAGVPLFLTMEEALEGLKLVATELN